MLRSDSCTHADAASRRVHARGPFQPQFNSELIHMRPSMGFIHTRPSLPSEQKGTRDVLLSPPGLAKATLVEAGLETILLTKAWKYTATRILESMGSYSHPIVGVPHGNNWVIQLQFGGLGIIGRPSTASAGSWRGWHLLAGGFGTVLIKTCHLDDREPTGTVVRCVTFVEVEPAFHAKHFAKIPFQPFYTTFNEVMGLQAIFWDTKSRDFKGRSTMKSIMTFISLPILQDNAIVFTFPLPGGFYERDGFVTTKRSCMYGRRSFPTAVIRLSYPATRFGSGVHSIQFDLEKMNLNSCVMDSIRKYEFVFPVDHDELYSINLPELSTWQELQQRSFLKSSPTTTACFPEFQMIRTNEAVNFAREHKLSKVLDGIPAYLYFMSHIHATEDTDSRGALPHRRKCIHDLNSVITLEFHGGRSCLLPDGSYRPCTTRIINGNVMQSFHYKSKCTSTAEDFGILFFPCDLTRAKYASLAIRNNVWKYLPVVKSRMEHFLTELKLV
ncbi:unnamed protein product [Notodromas monacha]|uniref:Glycosyltransferase family 92 protein n=1 Tax=Notodromas monacha TaxID=399045 RepID=A0A7R9BIY5_9CRUS|nr:unnamed protein product [Notodromas monacha]CAG0916372.1 unnamed protein product [Notodromas monacha]